MADPAAAARAIGAGLRLLHDALPVDDCPFDWSVAEPPGRHCRADARRRGLADPPPIDRLVVCHGDACAPNTLIDDDGHCSGHVDLGDLGVADRWADLAVATLSLDWNYPALLGGRAARRLRRRARPDADRLLPAAVEAAIPSR